MDDHPDKSQKSVKGKKLLPETLSRIPEVDQRILKAYALTKKEKMDFAEIAELTGMSKNKSNLHYHLKQLAKRGELKYISPAVYVRTEKKEDPITVKLWEVLSKDNYSAKSFEQIMESMKKLHPVTTKDDLEDLLMHLQWVEYLPPAVSDLRRVGIDATHDDGTVKKYRIIFWRLPHTVCHVCRKEFKDDELVITQLTFTPAVEIMQHPLHATCRPTIQIPEAQAEDEREACCNYCGLNVDLRHLGLGKEDLHNPLLVGAIEEIFESPYSKIFPFLDAKNNYLDHISQVILQTNSEFGADFDPISYACPVKKDGKYYHPYCAKQVEQLSK